MQCPRCGRENPAQARFCLNCGAKLVAVCPQCGSELPPKAKFCTACGASLTPPRPDPLAEAMQRLLPRTYAERLLATRGRTARERRLVTILFSDIKGFSPIAEKLDPEDVLDVVNGAFEFLIPPIYRYEGTLTQMMGDAILAFFGAPIAHEDDPERACRAALEIIAGSREYAARLERERGIRGFTVRVGMHTGLVVTGEVGTDLRTAYTAVGDTIVLAARMESAAEPGTVLMSEETQRLVAPLFETQALGPVEVKNRAEPVPVYRLLGSKAGHGKARGVRGLESPLVGRDGELGRLQAALERLRAGVGGIVTIVGEAGLGKSRLVAEVRSGVAPSPSRGGADPSPDPSPSWGGEKLTPHPPPCGGEGGGAGPLQWIEGRCLSYGGSIAYLLWLDVLRELLGVTEEQAPAEVLERLRDAVQVLCPERQGEVHPYLARLLSLPLKPEDEVTFHELGAEQLKAATFRAMELVIEGAARRRPLVLVCEDLHWADPTSLELLERLLALSDRASLLLICVLRPERDHGCWRIREAAAHDYPHRHTDLWLNPLSRPESESLVGNLLGVEGLPPDLHRRILARAEGNPFYVEEVIRALIDGGAIARDEASGQWQATRDVAEIAIPETLQGALAARIDRLQEDTRRVLRMASVIGRTFLQRVLAQIAEEERDLDRHLVDLQREEMIRERARLPELEYIFKHELTREAAYNGLLKQERRAYHRQVAEALERLFPDRVEEQLALLAHHWDLAGDAQKAVGYLLRAAQKDVRQYANQEAIAHFTRGLALVESLPAGPQRNELEFALQMGLGTPLVATQGYGAPGVARAWGRALELSQQMGDRPQLWLARSAIFQYYLVRAEHQTAMEIGRQLADAGERAGEGLLFPFPRGALGISCLYRGELEPARAHLEATLARYDPEKHRTSAYVYGQDVGVLYLSYLAWVLCFLGYVGQALERSREAVGLAQALGHPFTLAFALSLAGRLRASCRDAQAAVELAAEAAQVAGEHGFVFYQAASMGLLGWAHLAQGAVEQGEAEIRRALAMWQAAGAEFHRPHFLTWLAEACRQAGRIQEGLSLLAEALALVEKTGEHYYEAEIRRLQAELLLRQGHAAEAEAGFSQAIDVARRQRAKSLELRAAVSLSRLWQSQGRREQARALLAELCEWFGEGFDTPDLADARSLLAELSHA